MQRDDYYSRCEEPPGRWAGRGAERLSLSGPVLAEHSGHLVNYAQFGGSINVRHKTGQRYVGLLEQVFLIATVQPWFAWPFGGR